MKTFFKKQSGFSILEIVVAFSIITIGLVGVLSLTTQNVQVEYVNKNNLVASQLAQEGLELTRNIRDNNWLSGNDWDNGITPGNYIVDYAGNITSVEGIEEAKLQQSNDAGEEDYYWHQAGDLDSLFSRLITITQTSSESLNVSCLVQWEDRGQTYQYVADTILYDWR
ncbi:MAG: prepilin-type N-terminal cleavage/methylation domain-containing protein [Patescibacteria group bacterium]|nr:prepilin-type N-terminal cleavage/methylation domain-containing protein [Patescibacteria group bacterium]MDD5295067.1 prepilin-type N-terminal cleavage/methylation domain-containing protein [Patescibacteria group bacterium]MDD5554471.1 prepilin-type N-terminal cleavage/methylation domain-containing protein [Patescibacteria group bacterium]